MDTAERNFNNFKTWHLEDEIGVIGGKPKIDEYDYHLYAYH